MMHKLSQVHRDAVVKSPALQKPSCEEMAYTDRTQHNVNAELKQLPSESKCGFNGK